MEGKRRTTFTQFIYKAPVLTFESIEPNYYHKQFYFFFPFCSGAWLHLKKTLHQLLMATLYFEESFQLYFNPAVLS